MHGKSKQKNALKIPHPPSPIAFLVVCPLIEENKVTTPFRLKVLGQASPLIKY